MGAVNAWARDQVDELAEALVEQGMEPEDAQEEAERQIYGHREGPE